MGKNVGIILAGLLLLAALASAQTSITTLGAPIFQDFNALSSDIGVAQTWTDNTTISGWYANRVTYLPDTGGNNSGGLKSYGKPLQTDRCLGSLGSGSAAHVIYGWRLANNTGSNIDSFRITYIGEQWRQGSYTAVPRTDTVLFRYRTDLSFTNCTTGTWNESAALMFEGPIPQGTTAGALDGNDPANRRLISAKLDVSVTAGNEIMICWRDTNTIGTDGGLGIDSLTVIAYGSGGGVVAPTYQDSNITFSGVGATLMNVAWENGDGTGHIVLCKAGSAVDANPADGSSYTASSTFGLGDQIGTGNYVVYVGNGSAVSLTGLTASTTYHFRVYGYNGSGADARYKTTTALNNPSSQATGTVKTYLWNWVHNGDWTAPASWSPARNDPAADDIINFNSTGTDTVTNVPTQTIGKLLIGNNTDVVFQSSGPSTLTLMGGSGTDFVLGSGSSFALSGTNPITMYLDIGVTASLYTSVTFSGAPHKLDAEDVGAINFNSGCVFTQGPGCTGNVFTAAGTEKSITFKTGSIFVFQAGANPFGLTQPASKVQFGWGSLYRHESSNTPSFYGRRYANFELNLPGDTIITTSVARIDTLIVNAGTLMLNSNQGDTIWGGLDIRTGGVLILRPNQPADLIFFTGYNATNQTIKGDGQIIMGDSINLVVDGGYTLFLEKVLTVKDTVKMTYGKLAITSGQLNLGSTGRLSGETGTNYISGYVQADADIQPGQAYDFGGIGLELTTTPTSPAPGFTNVFRRTGTYYGRVPTMSIKRGFDILPAVNSIDATMVFHYFDEELNTITEANLGLFKSVDNGVTFTGQGGTLDAGANTLTLGITSLSLWTAGNKFSPLPVELLSFNAQAQQTEKKVNLSWSTASEKDIYQWQVERCADGTVFAAIATLNAAGNSVAKVDYQYSDEDNLSAGQEYSYRLAAVSQSGGRSYFGPVKVTIAKPSSYALAAAYPNPFTDGATIKYQLKDAGRVSLNVYNLAGQLVRTLVNAQQNADYHSVRWNGVNDASQRMAPGVYLYRLMSNGFSQTRRMLMVK